MALLPSGLETVDISTPGWNAIVKKNVQLLDQRLLMVMTAAVKLGYETVTPNGNTAQEAGAQNSQSPSVTTITLCADAANVDSNFTNIKATVDNIVSEMQDTKARINELKQYCDGLKETENGVITKLESMGVFGTGPD